MSDEPEEQDQSDEYDPDDYPDHDDDDNVVFKVDWIAAGILFFRVRPIDGEKEFEHCPGVSAAFVMKVIAIDISHFEFDVVWLEYLRKNLRLKERTINASMQQTSESPRLG